MAWSSIRLPSSSFRWFSSTVQVASRSLLSTIYLGSWGFFETQLHPMSLFSQPCYLGSIAWSSFIFFGREPLSTPPFRFSRSSGKVTAALFTCIWIAGLVLHVLLLGIATTPFLNTTNERHRRLSSTNLFSRNHPSYHQCRGLARHTLNHQEGSDELAGKVRS